MRVEQRVADLAEPDYRALFEASPIPLLVLQPDLTIVAVSDSFLAATLTRRTEILGRPLFEVFPGNLGDADPSGARNLRASLERVVRDRRTHVMPAQKYFICRRESAGSPGRWWTTVNTPVLDGDGEIRWIIHRAEEVTAPIQPISENPAADHLAPNQGATIGRLRDAFGEPDQEQEAHRGIEADLRKREELFRSFFEQAAVGFAQVALDGSWIRINSRLCDIVGYSREELRGGRFQDITHPDDLDADLALMGTLLAAKGGTYSMEKRYLRKDSRVVWVNFTVSLVRDEAGQPQYFISVIEEIDKRKAAEAARSDAEAALRQSEEKYRMLFDNMAEEVHFWRILRDDEGRIRTWQLVDANPPALRSWGKTLAEVVGKTADEIFGPGLTEHYMPIVQRIMATGAPCSYEAFFPDLDKHFQFSSVPMGEYFITSGADISGQKQAELVLRESEARLQEILSTLDLATVYVRKFDGTILFWSAGCERLYGWQPAEAVGRISHDLLGTILPIPLREVEAALMRDGEWTGDQRHRRRDGVEIIVAARQVLRRDAAGAPVAIMESVTDVTHLRRIEQELRQVNEELEQRVAERTRKLLEVNRELDSFAYTISHDLRAPLRAMEGFAEALLEDLADTIGGEPREFAERIVAAAKRMDALVEDVLAYSRLNRADLPLQRADPHRILRRVLADMRATIEQSGGQIEMTGPLPLVRANPTALEQVIANLVSNALKFVAAGEHPRVRIGGELRGDSVRLWVEDKGIGIAPEHQERIFRPFERLHGLDHYPGSGIGLAIVRKAVERMGGSSGVVSAPGAGSHFWIELPAAGEREGAHARS
jgi:PAS domain S-box-containing protein